MTDDLAKPSESVFRLDLTPPQLKIVYTAVKSFYDDFGHEERDVEAIVRSVLAKLPSEDEIRTIDLNLARRRGPL